MTDDAIRNIEVRVLKALDDSGWSDPTYWTIAQVAEASDIPWEYCRVALRSLTNQGLAQYSRGLFNEDGEVWGSGYSITRLGIEALTRKRQSK